MATCRRRSKGAALRNPARGMIPLDPALPHGGWGCRIAIQEKRQRRAHAILRSPYGREAIFISHEQTMQIVLDMIDAHIKEVPTMAALAKLANYSLYHFSRIFAGTIGVSMRTYVTWRKLQFALHDLSQGSKVIDVAMDYGFETHAGFTKAFAQAFGFPPSLCRLRLRIEPPQRADIALLRMKFLGGHTMNPHIYELTPFSVIGWPSRHTIQNMKNTADAPTYWNTLHMDYGSILIKLYEAFPKSKHCEISMCYDVNDAGEFSYMLGRGIDNPADLLNAQPDMTRIDIAGGLYAVFSTPPAADGHFIQTIQHTWNEIFTTWLPQSEFEFDEARQDFEYHDHRDHGWYFDGKLQIDICIPIRQREAERRKSQLRAER